MRRRARAPTLGLGSVLWLSCIACNPGRPDEPLDEEIPALEDLARDVARRMCDRFDDCGCDAYWFEGDDEDCEVAALKLAEQWVEASMSLRLDYHSGCVDRAPWTDCNRRPPEDLDQLPARCGIFSGIWSSGDSCHKVGPYMSTCAGAFACDVDGVCRDDAFLLEAGLEGHRCGLETGDYNTPCALGLACVDQRCVAAAALGEACGDEAPCGRPAWCDDGVCAQPLEGGSACEQNEACYSGVCSDDLCAEPEVRACAGFSW